MHGFITLSDTTSFDKLGIPKVVIKEKTSSSGSKDFDLRLYGPDNTFKVMSSQSVISHYSRAGLDLQTITKLLNFCQ